MKVPQTHLFSLKQAIFFLTPSWWGNTAEYPGPMLSHTGSPSISWTIPSCFLSFFPICSVHQPCSEDKQQCRGLYPPAPHMASSPGGLLNLKQSRTLLPWRSSPLLFCCCLCILACPWLGWSLLPASWAALHWWGTSLSVPRGRRPWTLHSSAHCSWQFYAAGSCKIREVPSLKASFKVTAGLGWAKASGISRFHIDTCWWCTQQLSLFQVLSFKRLVLLYTLQKMTLLCIKISKTLTWISAAKLPWLTSYSDVWALHFHLNHPCMTWGCQAYGHCKTIPLVVSLLSRHLNTYKALALLHLVALVLVGTLTSLYFFISHLFPGVPRVWECFGVSANFLTILSGYQTHEISTRKLAAY